ncbi:hypothetical protein Gotri_001378 [Gossypium trilobum]|uniref:(S)-2-hydroxy-acid oxidase n=1 Tax=Gossypium trilobum TaxID=34281 RepID=A0A7J9FGL4_9ROSI|nr:hypothetical protein [Gossypium trilobum]
MKAFFEISHVTITFTSTGRALDGDDSILSSYVARQIDHTLNWKTDYASFAIRITIHGGVAGITVSNHGARQLDYVPPTIIALTGVVNFAQGRASMFLDGDIRRRIDVFKL